MEPTNIASLTKDEIHAKYHNTNGKLTLFYHGPLSNWYYSPFTVDGIHYNCGEQWMMAAKARVFGDMDTLAKILACDGPWNGTQENFNQYPRAQKSLGREVKNFNPVVWDDVCRPMVLVGLMEKFRQNPRYLGLLADTIGTTLVEASPIDPIWGVGLYQTDPNIWAEDLWQGKNYLGCVLTQARILMVGR
jgi:ribA/ribD-fused uncharacterized protein